MATENMKPKYTVTTETAKLSISKGNSKIGKTIYAISTLPGDKDHMLTLATGELLTDIPGTCSGHCDECFNHGCYAVNSAKLHHNVVIESWAGNTILLREGKLFDEVEQYINKKNKKYQETGNLEDAQIRIFRINVSGEIRDAGDLDSWNKLAQKHPEINFGVYTKNYEALEEFMKENADTAANFVINVSQWHGVADDFLAKYPGKFNVFEYDDSNRKHNELSEEEIARLQSEAHCPAVNIKGHHATKPDGTPITCDMCKRCYRKTGKITAVYAH